MTTDARQHQGRAWRTHAVAPIAALDLLAFVAFALVVPGFGMPDNLRVLVIGALPLLALALGQTFVLISGGIDLAAPAIVGLTSVVGALAMSVPDGQPPGGAASAAGGLVVMLLTGLVAGLASGVSVGVLRMPAFMVTLGTGMFASGGAVWIARRAAGSETIYNLPPAFTTLGAHAATAAALVIAGALLAHVLLTRLRFGRWLQAVGYNPRAATVSGVPVPRVVVSAYVVSALFATLAAVQVTGALETASPAHGRPLLLDVIGATVLGGTSLAGGRGSIAGTVLGVAFLAMLGNALTLLNLSEFVITIVKGLLILGAALGDRLRAGAQR